MKRVYAGGVGRGGVARGGRPGGNGATGKRSGAQTGKSGTAGAKTGKSGKGKTGSPGTRASSGSNGSARNTRAGSAPGSSGAQVAPGDDRAFRLGAIPGATPGKWIQTWRERMPDVPLELEQMDVIDQRIRLLSGDVDAALVRLPLDPAGLHIITLYDEISVVVVEAESTLTAADDLGTDDLAGEVLIVPRDDVLQTLVPGTAAPAYHPPVDTAAAIEMVAAGAGIAIVPMSLARLHARKDVAHRVLRDGPSSTVALAWPAERTTADVEMFIGIVRGRTAHSSR